MEYVFIWFIFGVASSLVASNKGYDGCGYFILGMLLGPIGLLIAIFNPNKTLNQAKKERKCAYCGFVDESGAQFCVACGLDKKGYSQDHYKKLATDENYRKTYSNKEQDTKKEGKQVTSKIEKIGVIILLVFFLSLIFVIFLVWIDKREGVPKNHSENATESRIDDAESVISYNYLWLDDDFDTRSATNRFTILYSDLQNFKSNKEFIESGFDHSIYTQWLKKVVEIESSKNRQFLMRRGVDISNLKKLGQMYLKSRGHDNSLTKAISSVFDEVIEADFPIVDPNLLAEPIEQKKPKQSSPNSVNDSKVISYSNCYAQFYINGSTSKTTNDLTLMISSVRPGVYNVLFWIDASENFDFNYKYEEKIGSNYYYECSDCGAAETSRLSSRTKLSDFIKGKGGILRITTTDIFGTIIISIHAY